MYLDLVNLVKISEWPYLVRAKWTAAAWSVAPSTASGCEWVKWACLKSRDKVNSTRTNNHDSEQTSHYIVYLDASTFVSFKCEAARATGWTLMAAPFPNEPLPPNCSLAGWRQLSSVNVSFPETRQNSLQNNWLLRAYIENIQEIGQHSKIVKVPENVIKKFLKEES